MPDASRSLSPICYDLQIISFDQTQTVIDCRDNDRTNFIGLIKCNSFELRCNCILTSEEENTRLVDTNRNMSLEPHVTIHVIEHVTSVILEK